MKENQEITKRQTVTKGPDDKIKYINKNDSNECASIPRSSKNVKFSTDVEFDISKKSNNSKKLSQDFNDNSKIVIIDDNASEISNYINPFADPNKQFKSSSGFGDTINRNSSSVRLIN